MRSQFFVVGAMSVRAGTAGMRSQGGGCEAHRTGLRF